MRPSRSVRARGLATSLVVVLAYYVALTASVAIARHGAVDPVLAVWVPDALLAAAAVAMLGRVAADRTPVPSFSAFARGVRPAHRLAPS
jgi:lipopolysaccharide export system permease protein